MQTDSQFILSEVTQCFLGIEDCSNKPCLVREHSTCPITQTSGLRCRTSVNLIPVMYCLSIPFDEPEK